MRLTLTILIHQLKTRWKRHILAMLTNSLLGPAIEGTAHDFIQTRHKLHVT